MRSRNIKPGFFKNEELAALDPLARILFCGLWCLADKEGRFEWRPKRIKAEILPYDDCDIDKLLMSLNYKKFICIYLKDNDKFGFIPKFKEHQHPHPNEAKSNNPSPPENIELNQCHEITLNGVENNCNYRLIPDSLSSDSLSSDSNKIKTLVDKVRPPTVKKSFTVPSLEEIKNYCLGRKNKIDPEYFLDSNNAKGWVIGKNQTPAKDWKAMIRTWEKSNLTDHKKPSTAGWKPYDGT